MKLFPYSVNRKLDADSRKLIIRTAYIGEDGNLYYSEEFEDSNFIPEPVLDSSLTNLKFQSRDDFSGTPMLHYIIKLEKLYNPFNNL